MSEILEKLVKKYVSGPLETNINLDQIPSLVKCIEFVLNNNEIYIGDVYSSGSFNSNNCRLVEATGLEIMADDMVGIKFNVTENIGTKNQNDYSEINLFRIHTETNNYGNREWFQLEQVNDDGGLNGFQWCNEFNRRQEFSVNLLNHRKNHKEQSFNR